MEGMEREDKKVLSPPKKGASSLSEVTSTLEQALHIDWEVTDRGKGKNVMYFLNS